MIMVTLKYESEVLKQLTDVSTYKKIDISPVFRVKKRIKSVLTSALRNKIIDDETAEFLTSEHPITLVIYILPKVPKDPINPGHPIVSGMGSVTTPLAQYLDRCVTPLLFNTKLYIRDTSDFLDKIQNIKLSSDSLLVTWDVSSLTVIPHELGIKACRRLLIQLGLYEKQHIEFLLDLLKIVLDENYFLFKDTHFLQLRGAAMGSNVAPPYANAFMNMIETSFIFVNNMFLEHCQGWYRFVDNIFAVWGGDIGTPLLFDRYLNYFIPSQSKV